MQIQKLLQTLGTLQASRTLLRSLPKTPARYLLPIGVVLGGLAWVAMQKRRETAQMEERIEALEALPSEVPAEAPTAPVGATAGTAAESGAGVHIVTDTGPGDTPKL
ncbi:MAG: hypothetical protein ACOY4L_04010 [Pseudomonadota bacterium]